jgi:hypothetical protein
MMTRAVALVWMALGAAACAAPPAPGKATWKADLAGVETPKEPASGQVHGLEFTLDRAEIQGGVLSLRQGKEFFADREVQVFLFLGTQKPDGKSFEISRTKKDAGAPHVYVGWKPAGQKVPQKTAFTGLDGYAMRLKFGTAQNGKLPGQIYVCLPDPEKSFVAGSFEAEVK